MYIILEGPNCSGKTTVIQSKLSKIKARLPICVLKQDITEKSFKDALVFFLKTSDPSKLIDWHHLFYTQRVVPLLGDNLVIMDRFFPSLTAYQKVDPKEILKRDWGEPLYIFLPRAPIERVMRTLAARDSTKVHTTSEVQAQQASQFNGYQLFLQELQNIEQGLTL